MKTKFITKLLYGQYPYAIQIKHPALKYKNIRWRNRSIKLKPVEAFMYKLTSKELETNRSYFGDYGKWSMVASDHYAVFKSWDTFVTWYTAFLVTNPDVIGRQRHEGNTITFFTEDKKFCEELIKNFPDACQTYQKISDPALLPILEQAAQESTWLLKKEFVDHYPHNQYKYRVYLSWDGKDAIANMIEMFKSYKEADLIKLNSGFNPLLAGTGRLRFPAHILIKTEDTLELIKLALGPSPINSIIEYVLISDVDHSSP
jgi:hypothetical protein